MTHDMPTQESSALEEESQWNSYLEKHSNNTIQATGLHPHGPSELPSKRIKPQFHDVVYCVLFSCILFFCSFITVLYFQSITSFISLLPASFFTGYFTQHRFGNQYNFSNFLAGKSTIFGSLIFVLLMIIFYFGDAFGFIADLPEDNLDSFIATMFLISTVLITFFSFLAEYAAFLFSKRINLLSETTLTNLNSDSSQ